MNNLFKKIICTALILVMSLSLVACGNQNNAAPAEPSVTEVGTYKYSNLTMHPFQGATRVSM